MNSFSKQITQSSHLLICAAFNKVTIKHVQELIILTAKKQEVTIESLDGLFTAADAHFNSRSDGENTLWAQIEDTKNQKRWQDLL